MKLLTRKNSDHRPLIIQSDFHFRGHVPFKVFDWWFKDKKLMAAIESHWITLVGGNFQDKLRSLKFLIRKWMKEKFGDLSFTISSVKKLQSRADAENWEDSKKVKIKERLAQLYKARSSSLKQKSRLNRGTFNDKNTLFFHACIMRRRRRNQIRRIFHNNKWIMDQKEIKQEVFDYYSEFFSSKGKEPLFRISTLLTPRLTDEDSCVLETDFSMDEIQATLKGMDSQKTRALTD